MGLGCLDLVVGVPPAETWKGGWRMNAKQRDVDLEPGIWDCRSTCSEVLVLGYIHYLPTSPDPSGRRLVKPPSHSLS